MKYSVEKTINLPRARVIELFDDAGNMFKWQKGLQSFETISGEPGQPGAKARMVYDMNGRKVEMIETIEKRNLPDEFTGTYEASGVWNSVGNFFSEEGPDKTRWKIETEFRFNGLMRVISFFMRGSFPKQTEQMMQDFKVFAENEG